MFEGILHVLSSSCLKCPPLVWKHSRRRLRHSSIAVSMILCSMQCQMLANSASVRRHCEYATVRQTTGWLPISYSHLSWDRGCSVAIDPVECMPALPASEIGQCRVLGARAPVRCLAERWRTLPTRHASLAAAAVTAAHLNSIRQSPAIDLSTGTKNQVLVAELWDADRYHHQLTERCSCAQQTFSCDLLQTRLLFTKNI